MCGWTFPQLCAEWICNGQIARLSAFPKSAKNKVKVLLLGPALDCQTLDTEGAQHRGPKLTQQPQQDSWRGSAVTVTEPLSLPRTGTQGRVGAQQGSKLGDGTREPHLIPAAAIIVAVVRPSPVASQQAQSVRHTVQPCVFYSSDTPKTSFMHLNGEATLNSPNNKTSPCLTAPLYIVGRKIDTQPCKDGW